MKTSGIKVGGVVSFCLLAAAAWVLAQSVPTVKEQTIPVVNFEPKGLGGTYWSWQRGGKYPPLPYNPFPELPVQTLDETNRIFLIDDRSVDYEALNKKLEAARLASGSLLGLSEPGTMDSLLEDHPEGSLWLEIQQSAPYADSFYLFLHGSESGVEYKILGQPALLAGNFSLDGALLGATSTPFTTVWRLGRDMAFFRAVRSDGDTDGDRLPDWWELRYGLNPFLAADAAGDLDGDGISNLAEYGSETDPTTPDALLAFVAEPKSAAHIP